MTQIMSKMAAKYTTENLGLKNVIDSRKSIFINPMATKNFTGVKGLPF